MGGALSARRERGKSYGKPEQTGRALAEIPEGGTQVQVRVGVLTGGLVRSTDVNMLRMRARNGVEFSCNGTVGAQVWETGSTLDYRDSEKTVKEMIDVAQRPVI